jgi:hypothetical protein
MRPPKEIPTMVGRQRANILPLLLSAYCCIPLQLSLTCVNQNIVFVASEVSHAIIATE